MCGSLTHTDGDDVGKGVGASGEEASRGQEKIAKGLRMLPCPTHAHNTGCAMHKLAIRKS